MQLFKIKKGMNDYFWGINRNDDGFTWSPYHECMSGSPYSHWQTFREDQYCWLWWKFWYGQGLFNISRYRLKKKNRITNNIVENEG